MSGLSLALVSLQGSSPSSLWRTIVGSLPSDPASLFTLALAVGVTLFAVIAGTSSNKKGGGRGDHHA